jgi:hypothetical protein
MTHNRAFNSFYCFIDSLRQVPLERPLKIPSPESLETMRFVSNIGGRRPTTRGSGKRRYRISYPCVPPTPLRIADASPLAFLLHQPQTTLDHPDGMLAFLLGHVQTRYEPHRVRPGGQQQHPSMPGELDQLPRSLRVCKGDPSHESPSSDGRGDELWEHLRQA